METTTNEEVLKTSSPSTENKSSDPEVWSAGRKYLFRVLFIYFFLFVVPLDPDFYVNWFKTDWANLHIRDIGRLSGSSFAPIKIIDIVPGAGDQGSIQEQKNKFFYIEAEAGSLGLLSYINWALALVIGLVGAGVWSLIDKKSINHKKLNYFLVVAVSFSMLMKLQGLTFSKVFPSQMPDLAETQLNTPFGDFTPQKLYWIQLSFVHPYEIFVGLAELLLMLTLFFRQTRVIGAALSLLLIGNIAIANHVYDGGIHLAAAFYAAGGLFVLSNYLPSAWKLLAKKEDTKLDLYEYPFSKPWEKYTRIGFKTFVFLFSFVLSGYLHWHNYTYDSYKVPSRPGLANAKGLYEVVEFKRNGESLPYSPVDSVRWNNVTFEKWSTVSFSVFNTFNIHGEAGRGKQFKDVDRTYESAGTGGGRRHYYYEHDDKNKTITLFNKNKVYKDQVLNFTFDRPEEGKIILKGKNEYGDDLDITLQKKEVSYPLFNEKKKGHLWSI